MECDSVYNDPEFIKEQNLFHARQECIRLAVQAMPKASPDAHIEAAGEYYKFITGPRLLPSPRTHAKP